MIYAVEMTSDVMTQTSASFMTIGTGIQVILRCYLNNLGGYSVGDTGERKLLCAP
jgi:hypothetical protein